MMRLATLLLVTTALAACYRATRSDPPQPVSAMLQMLVPPLLALTHADGGLGCWQGSGAVPAERIAAVVRASGVRAMAPSGSMPIAASRSRRGRARRCPICP